MIKCSNKNNNNKANRLFTRIGWKVRIQDRDTRGLCVLVDVKNPHLIFSQEIASGCADCAGAQSSMLRNCL